MGGGRLSKKEYILIALFSFAVLFSSALVFSGSLILNTLGALLLIASAAMLFVLWRSFVPYLIVIPSYLIGFALSSSAIYALQSLLLFIPAFVITICVLRGVTRTPTVCLTSAAVGISTLALTAAMIFAEYGGFNFAAFAADISATVGQIKEMTAMELAQMPELADYIDEGMLDMVFTQIKLMMPAVVISALNLCAYLAVSVFRLFCRACGKGNVLVDIDQPFRVSLPCALIYIVAFAASLFATGTAIWSAVALNIYLILLFPTALVGYSRVFILMRNKKSVTRGIMTAIIIFVTLFVTPYAVMAASLFGAMRTISENMYDIRRFFGKK